MDDLAAGLEQHRSALQRLLLGWKAAGAAPDGYDVPAVAESVAHMVIPWTAQTHRFGRAFLRLDRVGLEHEAHPLVRSALEYAVVGHWAAHVGHHAVTARYAEDQRRLRALVKDVEGSPDDVVPGQWKAEMFKDALDEQPVPQVDERKLIDNFEAICRDLGVHNTLYPAYRVLCWITHPTTHAANVYIDGERRIADFPLYVRDRPMGLVGMMAYAVLWSRRTVDDLTVHHRYRNWLDEIASSIQAAPRLPLPKPARKL
jgi:hypothetical protein